MTPFENYLNNHPVGKWQRISELPKPLGLATLTEAILKQPIEGCKIETDSFFEFFRIVPATQKKEITIRQLKRDIEKTIIQGHEVLIFHRQQKISVENSIPVDLTAMKKIITEVKSKYHVINEYTIQTN